MRDFVFQKKAQFWNINFLLSEKVGIAFYFCHLMKKVFFFLILSAKIYSDIQAQTPFSTLKKGKYAVGFQTYFDYDATRPAILEQTEKSKGRVIQLNVWYPAKSTKTKPLNFNEYVQLSGKEINPQNSDNQTPLADYFDWTLKEGAKNEDIKQFKASGLTMWASREATPATTNSPVVLLMHGKVADFAFLGEFLASHGFVAIHTPYKGYAQAELDVKLLGMDTQVVDYEFAVSVLKSKIKADFSKVAVLGVSFGGQSAVAYTFRNPTQAVVSFDGGIGSQWGASLLTQTKEYQLKNVKIPLLHLFNPRDQYTNLTAIKKYNYCDRTLIGIKNMEHAHFWAWGVLDKLIPNALGTTRPGQSYEAVLQMTLDFLNKHQKGIASTASLAWVKSCQDSVEHLAKSKSS